MKCAVWYRRTFVNPKNISKFHNFETNISLLFQLQMVFSREENLTVEKVEAKRVEEGVQKRLRIVTESIHHARYCCKLPYLTGAAMVCYGVPLVAKPVSAKGVLKSISWFSKTK